MSKKLEDEPLFLEKSVRSVGVIVTTKFQELIYSWKNVCDKTLYTQIHVEWQTEQKEMKTDSDC